ncbi:TetR family transcriptional regulator [Geomonas silvestris]|uniref:TetR family transcriptional regulator n=1 Tax=Geomonas silvestris TaxID=2740184 RepID=A0A6V8MGS0_9BACT|nr:TetR/AcrR family transcriptional regulator [Geomonas silvestris]GFO59186.1 TetR family transcriptional regulator [Geomonas silvestris]
MKQKTETKRQAIVDEAARLFRAVGYERASMAELCARVGGSKATIYNYFSSKEELFSEVMLKSTEDEFEALHASLDSAPDDIGEALRRFGEHFLGFLYSPEVQATRHLAISQSKHSELGRHIYQRGVLRSQNLIAQFLECSMSAGKLVQTNPEIATRHLVSLLESEFIDRFLFHLPGEVSKKQIKQGTARAVEVFLLAYAPRS